MVPLHAYAEPSGVLVLFLWLLDLGKRGTLAVLTG